MPLATDQVHQLWAGDLVRDAREASGLTQVDVARRAGVPQSLVSAYETHRKQPTLPTLCRLLSAAGVEPHIQLRPLRVDRSYQPMTVTDLARAIATTDDGEDGWRLVWEFCTEYGHERLSVRRALVADEPPPTGDEKMDVVLAALVDHLEHLNRVRPPGWVTSRILDEPWYPFARSEEMRELARDEAPAAFRARNVMVRADSFVPA